MAPADRFVSETSFRVRYVETDAMGIVNHSHYISYFEEGRSAYARQRDAPYSAFEQQGFFLTVTEVSARYSKPARYDQTIIVRTWLEEMKSRGLTFAYEILDVETGELLVTGQSKHVCITRDGQVTRLPDALKKWNTG